MIFKKYYSILSLIFFVFILSGLRAQEGTNDAHQDEHQEEKHHFKHHSISFFIGHTHIESGVRSNGENQWLALPSTGLNYNYYFNDKWGIGLHNEMIIEEFIVKGNDSGHEKSSDSESEIKGIERGRPVAIAIMGSYKVHPHIALLAGGGMEFSEHEDFALLRIALEFPFHFGNNWEFYGALSFDSKIDAYYSFNFGFGIAKLF